MLLTSTYRGRDDPLEGHRIVTFRGLPADAVVRRATLTVTPTGASATAPFTERLVFGSDLRAGELSAKDWGLTVSTAGSAVEVDLHARRTLAGVSGTGIVDSELTVDIGGGLFMGLNEVGALRSSPVDHPFKLTAAGALPGTTVSRLRLTGAQGTAAPVLDSVSVRSVPANVAVGLGTAGAFWSWVGELAAPVTTPDFSVALRAFLLEAKVEHGSFVVPFGVHADGIARLDLTLVVEYLRAPSLLPGGLAEVLLPFDLSTFARPGSGALSVRLPVGAQVVEGETTARLRGAFDSTRTAAPVGADAAAAAALGITGKMAAAQPLVTAGDVVATGFDLLLAALGPTARLSVTLLGDSDGKPFGAGLLPAPLELAIVRRQNREPAWFTVALVSQFHLVARHRYWLVLQVLEGDVSWPASAAAPAAAPLQQSTDGGLSWTAALDVRLPGPLAALHRLRITPKRFTMPISVDVGSGPALRHVSLGQFEALGRIDFTLDTPQLAGALTAAAASGPAAACAPAEHLANGDLQDWVGSDLLLREATALSGSPGAAALSPDGRRAYVASSGGWLESVELACAQPQKIPLAPAGDPRALVLNPRGDRAYVLGEKGLTVADLSAAAPVGKTATSLGKTSFAGMAITPEGDRLLLLSNDGKGVAIWAQDTRDAERAAGASMPLDPAGGGMFSVDLKPPLVSVEAAHTVGDSPAPFAAVASGGETLLVFAVNGPPDMAGGETSAGPGPGPGGTQAAPSGSTPVKTSVPGRLFLLTLGRPEKPVRVTIGNDPVALAASWDGRRVVVACAGDRTLRVVARDGPTPGPSSIDLHARPRAVAIAADGSRAAVLSESEVAIYDLTTGRRITVAPLAADPRALVASPGLDTLIVAEIAAGSASDKATTASSSTGPPPAVGSIERFSTAAVPRGWTLSSGAVAPACFGAEPGALLGRRQVPANGDGPEPPTPQQTTTLSQAVAVTGGCRYQLGFRGIADQPESAGELLWRAADGRLVRSDRLAITELDPRQAGASANRPFDQGNLALHRGGFEAPAGAVAAELRFVVPANHLAALTAVSLRGTDAAGVNDDLRERTAGRPVGWTADPPAAKLSIGTGPATIVANQGTDAAGLLQSLAVTPGRELAVELVGRVTAAGADPGPRLELRFLAAPATAPAGSGSAGQPAAAASVALPLPAAAAPLSQAGFDRVSMRVEVPLNAAGADLRLVLPGGAAIEIERLGVRQVIDAEVPVVFRSAAPGELSVSAARVAYDIPEPNPPEGSR